MKTLLVPTLCYVAFYLVRRFLGSAMGRTYRDPSIWIVLVGMLYLSAYGNFDHPYRSVDYWREDLHRDWEIDAYMGTQVMNKLLPAGSVIGSWNSGLTGYFSRNPVVNLDGLVNSYEFLRAHADEVARFGLTHYTDLSPAHGGRPLLFESVLWDVERDLRFRLWSPETAVAEPESNRSERFWERMEPHLQHQPGGVGLLVNGRMAQAFVRDCAPDEPAVWTWGDGMEPVRVSWTRTQLGFCTSAIVLPHSASPPVRLVADHEIGRLVREE